MVKIKVCPPGYALGAREAYCVRSRKKQAPEQLPYNNATPDIRLDKVDIYWFTYTLLNPKRLNRLDVISSKAFIKLLENYDENNKRRPQTKSTERRLAKVDD